MEEKNTVGIYGIVKRELFEMVCEARGKWQQLISKWNKESLFRWIEIVVAFFFILDCNSVYRWWEMEYSWFAVPISIGLCLLLLLKYKEVLGKNLQLKNRLLKVAKIVAVLAVYTIATIWITDSQRYMSEMIQLYCSIIALVLLYCCFFDYRRLIQAYVDVMCVLAACSLVMLLISYVFPDFAYAYEDRIRWGNSTWRNYCFFFWLNADVEVLGFEIKRNLGIFTEPPMHSLNLSLALLFQMFMLPKKNHWKVLLLAVTIVSAMSSTGLLLLIFLAFYFVLYYESISGKRKEKQAMWFRIRAYIVVAVLVYGALLLRMVTINDVGGTITVRMEDYVAGIQAWLDSPLTGHGFKNDAPIFDHFIRTTNFGISNSPVSVLCGGGLLLAAVYIVPFVLYMRKMIRNHAHKGMMFGILFAYLFLTTIFPYTFVISLILALMLYKGVIEE